LAVDNWDEILHRYWAPYPDLAQGIFLLGPSVSNRSANIFAKHFHPGVLSSFPKFPHTIFLSNSVTPNVVTASMSNPQRAVMHSLYFPLSWWMIKQTAKPTTVFATRI